MNNQYHGLPDLPPHHRLVTKGTPWHERMLCAQLGDSKWKETDKPGGRTLYSGIAYLEPTYPPIPEGYELYDGKWIPGMLYTDGASWLPTNANFTKTKDRFPTIRPIKIVAPLLTAWDFMPGPWWVRLKSEHLVVRLVVGFGPHTISVSGDGAVTWETLRERYERSKDGITWEAC